MAMSPPSRLTRVEMVTMRPMPAVPARATMASRSSVKSGKSRWQWLSTSISNRSLYPWFDVARKHPDRRWQRHASFDPRAEGREVSRVLGNTETVEQLRGGVRHHRLRQDRDLAHDLRGDVQYGFLPCRIGLGQRPRRFPRKVAVRFGEHGP